jgi:hypothetical protein
LGHDWHPEHLQLGWGDSIGQSEADHLHQVLFLHTNVHMNESSVSAEKVFGQTFADGQEVIGKF